MLVSEKLIYVFVLYWIEFACDMIFTGLCFMTGFELGMRRDFPGFIKTCMMHERWLLVGCPKVDFQWLRSRKCVLHFFPQILFFPGGGGIILLSATWPVGQIACFYNWSQSQTLFLEHPTGLDRATGILGYSQYLANMPGINWLEVLQNDIVWKQFINDPIL